MQMLIVRHSLAEENNPQGDFARQLTIDGVRRAESLACFLASKNLQATKIFSSPYARTLKTAEILRSKIGLSADFEIIEALRSGTDLYKSLSSCCNPDSFNPSDLIVIVGHQPCVGDLVLELLGYQFSLKMTPATCVWLELQAWRTGDATLLGCFSGEVF